MFDRGLTHLAPTWFSRLARIIPLDGRNGPAAKFRTPLRKGDEKGHNQPGSGLP